MIEELIKISGEAGKAILTYYQEGMEVEYKRDDSPLTKADVAAHHVIVDGLRKLTPEIPIISEESGLEGYEERKKWVRFWLVDPLDGTKEFIKRNGEFTVNIALIEGSVPIVGVVQLPDKRLTYTGERGKGSFRYDEDHGRRQLFSNEPDLSRPLTVASSRSHGSDDLEKKLLKFGVTVGKKIVAGSSLKFCLVAEGTADIYPRFGPTMEWDTAAGDAVFRYSGRNAARRSPLHYNKPDLKNDSFVIGLKG